jgi:DNA-binding beta-propeller fold protein YncE
MSYWRVDGVQVIDTANNTVIKTIKSGQMGQALQVALFSSHFTAEKKCTYGLLEGTEQVRASL